MSSLSKLYKFLFFYFVFVAFLFFHIPLSKAQIITSIATDPFTLSTCAASNTTNHQTIVEPDSFSYGSTIVAAFQVGRIYDGGGCAIGFATSTDDGATFTSGLLPGLTKHYGGGTYDRATDPSVAYDASHKVWLISSLVLTETGGVKGVGIYTSRSTDGGITWGSPQLTDNTSLDPDKNWIVCDTTPSSFYYGNCYTQWDDYGAGNKLYISTSTDGGLTWSSPTSNNDGVIGGQPVVHPNGTVIVPTANAYETSIGAFYSTDGGKNWSNVKTIATIKHHTVAGSLREGPLPSAEIDSTGTVYVAWADCRFRTRCATNDIVFTKSTNSTGTQWSPITRVPIDPTNSGIDHFIPGLGVDSQNLGHIGLTYYYYPSGSTNLSVGFISSTTGGGSWSSPSSLQLSGSPTPLTLSFPPSYVATTSQGRMLGDYISSSFDSFGSAHGFITVAVQPTSGSSCIEITRIKRSQTTTTYDNCRQYLATFSFGLSGSANSALADPILFSGNGGTKAQNLWNFANTNSLKHRK